MTPGARLTVDYTDAEARRKARAAAVFFGEPAATEMRRALDTLDAVSAERDALGVRLEAAEAEIRRRDNECGRVWYAASAQEDRVCRLPRGHAPVLRGCEGEPPEDES